MIKALYDEYECTVEGKRRVVATLVSDTSEEVIAHGTSGKGIENLQPNDVMTFGSTCMTVDGKWGMLNSANKWKFKG